jgi:ABC-type amino acid transport substrate-binding protein
MKIKIKMLFLLILSLSVTNIYSKTHLKSVTIGVIEYPSYIEVDKDGNFSGISHYIASEVFKASGYKVTFKIFPYKRLISHLFKNKKQVMMGIFAGVPGYERHHLSEISYMYFPTTYFYNSKLHPEFKNILNISQTKNKSVSILSGSGVYENVITDSGGKPERVTHESQVFKLLASGRVDFAHTGLINGIDKTKKTPKFKKLLPLSFTVTNLLSGLMFPKSLNNVRDDFHKTVVMLHKSGGLLKIYKEALKNYPEVDAKLMLPQKISIKVNIPISLVSSN